MKKILIISLFILFAIAQSGCSPINNNPKNEKDTDQITTYPTSSPYELKEGTATEFSVSGVFSSNMIIQRDQEINIYGTAPESENGKIVFASLKGLSGSAEIENGKWKIVMQGTLPASIEKGHSLTVSGSEGTETVFKDILIGDVWFVGGQSNADLSFGVEAQKIYANDLRSIPKDSIIRIFQQLNYDLNNGKDKDAVNSPQENPLKRYKWKVASQGVVQNSSMMGYFFAKTLTELNPEVPIGLVMVSCGGAALSLLAPKNVVETFPQDMINNEVNLGTVNIPDSGIYNAFIHPFVNYGIRRMIFFQGESDTLSSASYGKALKTYVQDLRDQFKQNFLFLNVQLSSYGYYVGDGYLLDGPWNNINGMRNAQSDIKINNIISNYEVVTSYDIGWQEGDSDGAHPLYKKPLGERLGVIASSLVYGIGDMEYVGCPIPAFTHFESDKVIIEFKYVGDGLKLKSGSSLNGFEVKVNNVWEKCNAEIDGNKVIINISKATGVRFANDLRIQDDSQANLVSSTDYPAVSFSILKSN